MTEPPHGGADGTDGPVHDAGPLVALPPLLNYKPDRVIERMSTVEIEFVIGTEVARGINAFGDLLFNARRQRYCFRFTTETPGYIITSDDLFAAVRGDIDRIEADALRGEGDPHDHNRYTIAHVSLPRPHLTAAQRGWKTRRFNEWLSVRQERDRVARERDRRRQEKVSKADDTAWATLKRFLTPEQRTSLEVKDWFVITGSEGTKFRVYGPRNNNCSGNVWWLNERGQPAGQLCAHCDTWRVGMPRTLPLADHILTQVLEIVTDEKNWMSIAHHLNGQLHPAHSHRLAW